MREMHRTIKWRAVRTWISEHFGLFLVIVVSAYLVGFFWYHTFVPVDALMWRETARYSVGDSCELMIEYPGQVPLASLEEPGYLITARMYYTGSLADGALLSHIACVSDSRPISYTVELGPLGQGLEFTDEEGATIAAAIPLALALTESAVTPAKIYLRRAPSADIDSVRLSVRVETVDKSGASAFLDAVHRSGRVPSIHLQSRGESRWEHLPAWDLYDGVPCSRQRYS